ncbi:MAG: aminoglycoside 6-adenylyltransferase [Candidatus Woesebacteria bacterium]|nr:aminoglycoside 6-adenylyltransferase [Candidatus Woesebacteria bacterium]
MMSPKEITDALTKIFQDDPRVVAFTLVGSQAREDVYKATKYSDMEGYIITKDEFVEAVEGELLDILTKFGKILFSFKHDIGFMAIYEDLFRIETPVIKESGMKQLFSRPKFQTVKILVDKTNGELRAILDKRPDGIDIPRIFKDKVVNFWNWQIIGAQYLKKGEIYNTRAILNIHASVLIKLFELINDPNILLLETNKRVEEFLTSDQLKVLAEITPSYDKSQIEKSLWKVMDIFPVVFKDIKEKYGYSYDESLEEKVKPRVTNLLNQ